MAHAQAIWYRHHSTSFGDNQGPRDSNYSYVGSALYDQVWTIAPMATTCFWKMSMPLHSSHLIWRKQAGKRSARSFRNRQPPNGMNRLLRWGSWDVHTRRKQKKPIRLQSWTSNCGSAVNTDNGSDSLFFGFCGWPLVLLWIVNKQHKQLSSACSFGWFGFDLQSHLNSVHSSSQSKIDLGEGRLHAPDGRWWDDGDVLLCY